MRPISASVDRRALLTLLVLVVVSIFVRWPFFSVPMITDEGGYAYVARFWSSDYQLYRDIPFDRPQAIFLIYRLIFNLVGDSASALRLAAALFNAGSVVALFFFAWDVGGRTAAVGAAGLYAVFSASPWIEGFTANAETFMSLPLIVAAHLSWRRCWFLAGLVSALAVLLKPSGLSAVVFAVGLIWTGRAGWRSLARLLFGFVLGLMPSIAHGLWTGWRFYWQSIHERRLALYDAESVGLVRQLVLMSETLRDTASSLAVPGTAAVMAWRTGGGPGLRLGVFWLATAGTGIAMGGWWRWHYMIQAVAPLSFIGGLGLSRWQHVRTRGLWCAALGVAAFFYLLRDGAMMAMPPKAASWALYRRAGYLVQEEVAEYIKRHSEPTESIYVAFAEAELYFLSDRRAAVPQLYFLHAQYSERLFADVVDAIRAGKPRIVILVQAPPANRMPPHEFLRLLRESYVADAWFRVPIASAPPIVAFRRP